MEKQKVIVYVDGFNFYYGLRKNRWRSFLNDTYEEKESDVRIATQIVADAFRKNCDISIVVSADSDMIPAMGTGYGGATPGVCIFPAIPAFVSHCLDVHQRHSDGALREPFPL